MKPRLRNLRLSQLLPAGLDPAPHRSYTYEEIGRLADDIRAHGLLRPIIVTPDPPSKKYRILAGYRRVAAYRMLARPEIRCEIVTGTDPELFITLESRPR